MNNNHNLGNPRSYALPGAIYLLKQALIASRYISSLILVKFSLSYPYLATAKAFKMDASTILSSVAIPSTI